MTVAIFIFFALFLGGVAAMFFGVFFTERVEIVTPIGVAVALFGLFGFLTTSVVDDSNREKACHEITNTRYIDHKCYEGNFKEVRL